MAGTLGVPQNPLNEGDQERENDAIELLDELLYGLERMLDTLASRRNAWSATDRETGMVSLLE